MTTTCLLKSMLKQGDGYSLVSSFSYSHVTLTYLPVWDMALSLSTYLDCIVSTSAVYLLVPCNGAKTRRGGAQKLHQNLRVQRTFCPRS